MKKEDASIAELIKEIKLGALLLPEFQRGYVWKNDQVKSYVDSLYRGYPTGHFLIWKTYTPHRNTLSSKRDQSILGGVELPSRRTKIFVHGAHSQVQSTGLDS